MSNWNEHLVEHHEDAVLKALGWCVRSRRKLNNTAERRGFDAAARIWLHSIEETIHEDRQWNSAQRWDALRENASLGERLAAARMEFGLLA